MGAELPSDLHGAGALSAQDTTALASPAVHPAGHGILDVNRSHRPAFAD
jgi:hypothetical protein